VVLACRFIYHFALPCSSPETTEETPDAVTIKDLHHLWLLVEEKDGGLAWNQMMDRSTPTMSYKAWRREPKVCYFLGKIFWSYLNYLLYLVVFNIVLFAC